MILQQSQSVKNGYVLTNPEKGIVIRFIAGRFNQTAQVTILEDIEQPEASEIAYYLREMGDWLAVNHPELIRIASGRMYYHAKNSGLLYCVIENADGSLFITLDGETPIPNAGLFVKNLGGIEAVKAKCFRTREPLRKFAKNLRRKRLWPRKLRKSALRNSKTTTLIKPKSRLMNS